MPDSENMKAEDRFDAESEVLKRYPEQINPYCGRLIREHPELAPMYLADPRELDDAGLQTDGLGEKTLSPFPHLIRTYRDRALLLTTAKCFARCRFCFRKRLWRTDSPLMTEPDDRELLEICAWLKEHPEIDDVLLSGGDAMTLSDDRLLRLVAMLKATGTVSTCRICSRAPAVEPDRITDSIAAALGAIDGVWFVCHINHPSELTAEAEAAIRRLVSHGVPLLNQCVLLKGINDDAAILRTLFKRLAALRVKPHYLFHIDPVEGVAHFSTGVRKGLEIMEEFRDTLSSIARPDFAIDLPSGGGKVILAPDDVSADGNRYWSAVKQCFMTHPLAGGTGRRK